MVKNIVPNRQSIWPVYFYTIIWTLSEDMPDSVKVNYVKAIVQFIYEENDEIDGSSLSEIQTLMAQLAFDVALRQEVRFYIAKLDESLEHIIQMMITHIPRGSEGALRISLIKDMIRVYRVKNTEIPAIDIRTIQHLANHFHIKKSQIEVIEEGIKNDEKIMRGEVKDDQIIKTLKIYLQKQPQSECLSQRYT